MIGSSMRKAEKGVRTGVVLPIAQSRWLQVVTHLDPKYGGLSAAVPELGRALGRGRRCSVELAAFCAAEEHFEPTGYNQSNFSFWPASRGSWLHNESLRRNFQEKINRADGVHIHGLWEQSTSVAARMARASGKPYVLSAHGMLERWALRNKRLKKFVYSALFERATVQGAACLHALTRAEAKDYLRFGARGPIAVVPNGVKIPKGRDAAAFLSRFPELTGKRMVLFLGRLHKKKGVDLLVEAWAQIAKEWPEGHLVVAGPDSDGMRAELEKSVASHRIQEQVTFTGMLEDELKWSALAAAEGFVLPSHSEGLSVGVLEAMGMGLPVIVTAQCNMPEVTENEAGWEIQPEIEPLRSALEEMMRNGSSANAEIGCRGSYLVQQRYNWDSVALRMADVYRWVQGGAMPYTVDLVFG